MYRSDGVSGIVRCVDTYCINIAGFIASQPSRNTITIAFFYYKMDVETRNRSSRRILTTIMLDSIPLFSFGAVFFSYRGR